ncbi:MAG: hypothetical protein R3C25_10595 [Hyphomonadaceae bacterium]
MVFHVPQALRGAGPLGLQLSGPFSASATWNDTPIGAKGVPGPTREQETPGPIDTVLPIPPTLVRAGENVAVLTMSTQALPGVRSIINGPEGISVRPYSADPRRPLAGYLLPLALSGVLIAALATLLRRKDAAWLAVFVAALIIVAASEMSRSFVNYPYPLHATRAWMITGASAVAAIAVAMIAASEMGLRQHRLDIALATTLAIVFVLALVTPTDPRSAYVVAVGAGAALAISLAGAPRDHSDRIQLCACLALIAICAIYDPRAFFDRVFYAASLPLIAYFALRRSEPEAEPAPAPLGQVAIGSARRRRLAAPADIRAVHGAGAAAEFELATGERILDERTLAQWANRFALFLCAQHRSHRQHQSCVRCSPCWARQVCGGDERLRAGAALAQPRRGASRAFQANLLVRPFAGALG